MGSDLAARRALRPAAQGRQHARGGAARRAGVRVVRVPATARLPRLWRRLKPACEIPTRRGVPARGAGAGAAGGKARRRGRGGRAAPPWPRGRGVLVRPFGALPGRALVALAHLGAGMRAGMAWILLLAPAAGRGRLRPAAGASTLPWTLGQTAPCPRGRPPGLLRWRRHVSAWWGWGVARAPGAQRAGCALRLACFCRRGSARHWSGGLVCGVVVASACDLFVSVLASCCVLSRRRHLRATRETPNPQRGGRKRR